MRSGGHKPLHSWQWGLVYLALWLIPAAALKILFDNILESVILHVAYIMILLPAATFAATFIYTRRCGLKPWFICYLTASCAVLYFFCGFDSLSPNFLVVNLIGGFFGSGLGNVLKNEPLVSAQEDIDNSRKKKKLAQEKEYVSIIDDKRKK